MALDEFSRENGGIDISSDDDAGSLRGDQSKLQRFHHHLNDNEGMFGMCFTPLKCKIPLQNRTRSTSNFVLEGRQVGGE